MIDTHAHLYDQAFAEDRDEMIARAQSVGVRKVVLPNIDRESLPLMLRLERDYPDFCYAAIGLHPTSVKDDYQWELRFVERELKRRKYIAVGEIGVDLYWDKRFLNRQLDAFQKQVEWALQYELPVIIHMRKAFRETLDALAPYRDKGLRGVFHSFEGTPEEVKEILDFKGFFIGINGIVTFKKSTLFESLPFIGLENILLETDSPYLSPAPFRGKRNESAYLLLIAQKIADYLNVSCEEVRDFSTKNANELYKF